MSPPRRPRAPGPGRRSARRRQPQRLRAKFTAVFDVLGDCLEVAMRQPASTCGRARRSPTPSSRAASSPRERDRAARQFPVARRGGLDPGAATCASPSWRRWTSAWMPRTASGATSTPLTQPFGDSHDPDPAIIEMPSSGAPTSRRGTSRRRQGRVMSAIEQLDRGEIRVAEKRDGGWVVTTG